MTSFVSLFLLHTVQHHNRLFINMQRAPSPSIKEFDKKPKYLRDMTVTDATSSANLEPATSTSITTNPMPSVPATANIQGIQTTGITVSV